MDDSAKKSITQKAVPFLIILNLVTMAALWYVLFRKPPAPRPPRAAGQGQDVVQSFLRRELSLTDEQAATFLKLRDKFVASTGPLQEELRTLNETIIAEMLKPQPDKAAIEKATARIGILRGEERKLLFFHFLDLMDVCRPEQKDKFHSILREFLTRIGFLNQPGGLSGGPRLPDGRGGPPPNDKLEGQPPQDFRGGPPRQDRGKEPPPPGRRMEPPPPPPQKKF